MISVDSLREEWRERARTCRFEPTMTLTDDGLVLGDGTVLAKRRSAAGHPQLALDGIEERVVALLSVTYGSAVDPAVLGNIRRAA